MSEPLIQSTLLKCDIRGCVGVGEYSYVSTTLDRPAVLLVCSVHRLEQWTFVHRAPTSAAGSDSDILERQPCATISREQWLRLEIEAAESYVARFRSSDDEVERAQVGRREREAVAYRAELAALELPPTDAEDR